MFGLELMDYQKYCFEASFYKQFVLWLLSRNAGKSVLSAPFNMTKMMLFPNFNTYILSLTAGQSQDTYMNMERIAKKQIESFTGLSDVFLGEVSSTANSDGFIHAPSGFKVQLNNNSSTKTVSGDEKTAKGKRSNLNIYDESGWLSQEYIADTKAFTLQDSSFKLGGGIDTEILPENIANQLLFCSSASDTTSEFYRLYKEYTKRMLAYGDQGDYFTASLDCDVVIGATLRGKKLNIPLLSQTKVDAEMSINPTKALREYYNKFDADGGEQQPIKKAEILRNSKAYKPILCNDTPKEERHFAIAFDPAHDFDNSIISVAEYYRGLCNNNEIEWRMKIVNCINLTDLGSKKHTPMKQPDQINKLKQIILDYNGKGVSDYKNIDCILIDSGAGGGGNTIPDYFYEDWIDEQGGLHKGLIDRESKPEESKKYNTAVDKIRLTSPKKYKIEIFDNYVELLNLGVIDYPLEYDNKGYLMLPIEGKEIEDVDEETGEVKKVKSIEYKKYKLSFDEELALTNIDIGKDESVAVRRDRKDGSYKYTLPSDITGSKLKDDRCYTYALLAKHLHDLRREYVNKPKKVETDLGELMNYTPPTIRRKRL